MIPGERRRHACMEGGAQRESAIGWKTEASGRAEGRAGRRRPGEKRAAPCLLRRRDKSRKGNDQ